MSFVNSQILKTIYLVKLLLKLVNVNMAQRILLRGVSSLLQTDLKLSGLNTCLNHYLYNSKLIHLVSSHSHSWQSDIFIIC